MQAGVLNGDAKRTFVFSTVTVLRPREHDSSLSLYLSCRCLLKSSRKHLCLNGDPDSFCIHSTCQRLK